MLFNYRNHHCPDGVIIKYYYNVQEDFYLKCEGGTFRSLGRQNMILEETEQHHSMAIITGWASGTRPVMSQLYVGVVLGADPRSLNVGFRVRTPINSP